MDHVKSMIYPLQAQIYFKGFIAYFQFGKVKIYIIVTCSEVDVYPIRVSLLYIPLIMLITIEKIQNVYCSIQQRALSSSIKKFYYYLLISVVTMFTIFLFKYLQSCLKGNSQIRVAF